MKEKNFDLKIALDEMRIDHQNSLDAGDIIDKKLNQIIIASGIIVTVGSVLDLFDDLIVLNFVSVVKSLIILIYFLNIFFVLRSSRPTNYRRPISPDWDVLNNNIFDKPEREIYLSLLSGYVDQINHNRKINNEKAKAYFVSMILISINFFLFIIVTIFN